MHIERINNILRIILYYVLEIRFRNSVLYSLLRVTQSLQDFVDIQIVFKFETAFLEQGAKSINLG